MTKTLPGGSSLAPRPTPEIIDAVARPVTLQQSLFWSRAILWSLMGVTVVSILWACLAKIDEAVPVMGKLEPPESVKDIKAPLGGVVQKIHIQEGEKVAAGQLLLTLDTDASLAKRVALEQVRQALKEENAYYSASLAGTRMPTPERPLPAPLLLLTQNRFALLQENDLFRTLLAGGNPTAFTPEQQTRLRLTATEMTSLVAVEQSAINQLDKQIAQAKAQLANAREVRDLDEQILRDYTSLVAEGGIARVQQLQQQQKTSTARADVIRFQEELQRLQQARYQAEQRRLATQTNAQVNIHNRIADNDKRIAEIDSQLRKAISTNEQQIAQIDSQLAELAQTLRYQHLRAPVAGTIFNLKAKSPGFVINSTEPVVQVVPTEKLIAQVFISNQNIGFVRPGMPVKVQVDAFPASEFGKIPGTLIEVGSDALPPDQVYPFFRFPAKVALERQYLQVENKQLTLQPGMSVTAHIQIRQRPVIALLTDLFTRQVESLEGIR